jgi:hypothetical protein
MKRFFFDLVGEIRACDFMGHECSSKKEAKSHAAFIAHRIGTERPSFAKQGNFIAVRDERGVKIFAAPILARSCSNRAITSPQYSGLSSMPK